MKHVVIPQHVLIRILGTFSAKDDKPEPGSRFDPNRVQGQVGGRSQILLSILLTYSGRATGRDTGMTRISGPWRKSRPYVTNTV